MSELEEDPRVAAKRLGFTISYPGDRELFIDIDDDEGWEEYQRGKATLTANGVRFEREEITVSPGGAGFHVRLTLCALEAPLTDVERIAYQAALGSDRKRELLALLRLRFGMERPATVFFERPVTCEVGE